MTTPSPSPSNPAVGGGAPIALAVLLGTIIGALLGQPTIGFLAGLAIGIAAAVAIWRLDRRADRGRSG